MVVDKPAISMPGANKDIGSFLEDVVDEVVDSAASCY